MAGSPVVRKRSQGRLTAHRLNFPARSANNFDTRGGGLRAIASEDYVASVLDRNFADSPINIFGEPLEIPARGFELGIVRREDLR